MVRINGPKLRELRKARGYSSGEHLAHELGVSWVTVNRWERGVNTPSLAGLYQLAELLDVEPAELVITEPEVAA